MVYAVYSATIDGKKVVPKEGGTAAEHYTWCVRNVMDTMRIHEGKRHMLPVMYKDFLKDMSDHTGTKKLIDGKVSKNFNLTTGFATASFDQGRLLLFATGFTMEDGFSMKLIEGQSQKLDLNGKPEKDFGTGLLQSSFPKLKPLPR